MLIAVNFHYIRESFDSPHPSIHGLTPRQFEKQLEVLSRAGSFVSSESIRSAVAGERTFRKGIVVTFDDGLREQYDLAVPVLRRMGIPACFFVNTAPIAHGRLETVHKIHLLRSVVSPHDLLALLQDEARDLGMVVGDMPDSSTALAQYPYDSAEAAQFKYLLNVTLGLEERDRLMGACFEEVFPGKEAEMSQSLYMDVAQIQSLGDAVGSHSHRHLPLGVVRQDVAANDIRDSMEHLKQWLGRDRFGFSYPYGSREVCTELAGSLVGAAGFMFGFTMERAQNVEFDKAFHLARIDCNDAPGGRHCDFRPEDLFERLAPARWYSESSRR